MEFCIGGIILSVILSIIIGILFFFHSREESKLKWEKELNRRHQKALHLLTENELSNKAENHNE